MTPSLTHAERRAKSARIFQTFAPGADPEQLAATLETRMGVLGGMVFDVVGDVWTRPGLSPRDRSLLVISVLAAQARDEELESHTTYGLRNGLRPDEIEEILPMVAVYAGFPAAMASSRRIDKALLAASGAESLPPRQGPAHKSDAERDRDAAEVLGTMTGRAQPLDPAEGRGWMEGRIGDMGAIGYRWGFGEVWARPQLSRRDRSIIVIGILASLGAAPELAFHVPAGLRHGLTRTQVEEVITHLSLYIGFPRAVEAMNTAREAFARLDAPTPA
jgi:4-carboxymuconolactone decarboxylase